MATYKLHHYDLNLHLDSCHLISSWSKKAYTHTYQNVWIISTMDWMKTMSTPTPSTNHWWMMTSLPGLSPLQVLALTHHSLTPHNPPPCPLHTSPPASCPELTSLPSCWPPHRDGCSPPCPLWWHTCPRCCPSPGRWRSRRRWHPAPASWPRLAAHRNVTGQVNVICIHCKVWQDTTRSRKFITDVGR